MHRQNQNSHNHNSNQPNLESCNLPSAGWETRELKRRELERNDLGSKETENNETESSEMDTRKYYVQSGDCQKIVQSRDAEAAAIWALHQFLDAQADLESIDWFDEDQMDNLDLINALLMLGEDVRVSEQGFGRSEAGWFDTADVMNQWHHFMVAIHRMDIE